MKIKFTFGLMLLFLTTVCCFSSFAQTSKNNQVVEVPFDFYRNEIILQVKINGKGFFNMMLDTGTDPSAIDLKAAKEIGLKLASVGHQGSGGGTDVNLVYKTKLALVEVDGFAAKNIEALAIDLSKPSAALGKQIHGVLGHSFFEGRVVQIDFPKRVVRFFSKSPFPKKANQTNSLTQTVLPFRYNDNFLIDDVFVNGKKMTANFDTGSNGNFQLTPAAVIDLGLEAEVAKAQVGQSVGFNGAGENRTGKIKNVTIGGISIDEPTVVFFGKGTGRDKEPWSINIGNAFLSDFVATIDYRNKTITLEKP
jgi:predicted aspartyl protease